MENNMSETSNKEEMESLAKDINQFLEEPFSAIVCPNIRVDGDSKVHTSTTKFGIGIFLNGFKCIQTVDSQEDWNTFKELCIMIKRNYDTLEMDKILSETPEISENPFSNLPDNPVSE